LKRGGDEAGASHWKEEKKGGEKKGNPLFLHEGAEKLSSRRERRKKGPLFNSEGGKEVFPLYPY